MEVTQAAPRRKLAAILSADVAGYSRLMEDDERATLDTLQECRQIMRDHIVDHGGRVVDFPGDALLAEFASPVESVRCAVEIQRTLLERNVLLPEHRRMSIRIGLNLGDIIEQDSALYGDAINVAARLQAIAEPGGICVSGTVFDQVEGKLPVSFTFAGEQAVKNITKPVRIYHLRCEVTADQRPSRLHAMPSGPTIAVLPFTNMSSDPEQEYFTDGLTEDILTELARFRELNVLARNITFQYKGVAVDLIAIGKKLGAQYVLEGSVRKSENLVRITAQLIDARSGSHVWAEKYDRSLSDIFVVQDEITGKIVGTIAGGAGSVIARTGRATVGRKPPDELQAYDHVLRASMTPNMWSKEEFQRSKAHLQRAIELDPNYARARQEYAWTVILAWLFRFDETALPRHELKANSVRSVQLDPAEPLAHRTAAFAYFFGKEMDFFEGEAQSALNLAPNNAEILVQLGTLIGFKGEWDRGVELVTKAMNLNPMSAAGWYHTLLHYDLYRKGQYQEAVDIVKSHPFQQMAETQYKYVAAYGQLGDRRKAREHWEKCIELESTWSAASIVEILRLWNFEESYIEGYMQGIAKAGFLVEG
ncbi:MAG: adenylate/guanylate cyclase domain-containing protein [Parvularculaceae bacterium]|nr:adenylate/guanylate cyclase domain-containing protein [Parvularculaceae bacterium]